jgi:hypothetical protein
MLTVLGSVVALIQGLIKARPITFFALFFVAILITALATTVAGYQIARLFIEDRVVEAVLDGSDGSHKEYRSSPVSAKPAKHHPKGSQKLARHEPVTTPGRAEDGGQNHDAPEARKD